MATPLKSKPGLTGATALSIPKDWDATWFRNFINNMMKGADVRNAVGTNGITVSGTIASPYATISGAGLINSVVGTANEIAVSTVAGVATISFAPNIVIPAPVSGTVLIVNGAAATIGVQINTPSDSQLELNANTGGRYSTLVFSNAGTSKAQIFWDNTNSQLDFTAGSGLLTLETTGRVLMSSSANPALQVTATGIGLSSLDLNNTADTNGAYMSFRQNGVVIGYVGGSANIAAFGTGNDWAVRGGAALYFFSNGALTPALSIATNGGLTLAAATGGSQGNGTLNATGYFLNSVPLVSTGSFTGTYVGGTTSPTVTVKYTQVGNMVTLYIPTASATSNSTSFTMSGLPAALQAVSTKFGPEFPLAFVNNSAAVVGGYTINAASGSISWTANNSTSGASWTNAGTKSWPNMTITYSLD